MKGLRPSERLGHGSTLGYVREVNSPIKSRGFLEERVEFASQNNGFYYFSYRRASVGRSNAWTLSVLAHRHPGREFSRPVSVPQQVATSSGGTESMVSLKMTR